MPYALHLAMASMPHLPVESVVLMTLAAGVAFMAALGPVETPPSEEVTSAAVFALHGHI